MFLASCSTGRYLGYSTNINQNQTQVVLSQANFKVVKQVTAEVSFRQSEVLGFLSIFNKNQAMQSAYAALIKEANLQGSQALINVTFETVQRERQGLVTRKFDTYVLASGVVIEFTN